MKMRVERTAGFVTLAWVPRRMPQADAGPREQRLLTDAIL